MNGCCTPDYELCIQQNATFTRVFVWTAYTTAQSTAGAVPQPVNLTGWSAAMQIRPFPGSSTVLYDVGAEGGITLGGAAGTITVTIPASATEDFTWFSAVYDLLLTDPSGNVTRFIGGNVTVSPGVTP